MNLSELQREAHAIASEKGWRDEARRNDGATQSAGDVR